MTEVTQQEQQQAEFKCSQSKFDRETWSAEVHGVAKSRTRPDQLKDKSKLAERYSVEKASFIIL